MDKLIFEKNQEMLIFDQCLFEKNVKDVKKIYKRKLTLRNILASQVFKTVDIIGKLLVLSEPWTEKDH